MKPWSVSPFWFKYLTAILRTRVINEHHFTWAHSNWLRSSKRQQIFAALIFVYLKCNETSTVQLVKRGHRTLVTPNFLRDVYVWEATMCESAGADPGVPQKLLFCPLFLRIFWPQITWYPVFRYYFTYLHYLELKHFSPFASELSVIIRVYTFLVLQKTVTLFSLNNNTPTPTEILDPHLSCGSVQWFYKCTI